LFNFNINFTAQVPQQANPHMYNPSPYQMQPARTSAPVHPEVKIVKLPFYDVQAELLKPASLNPQGSNRFQVKNLESLDISITYFYITKFCRQKVWKPVKEQEQFHLVCSG
jgi:hypothetical protein